VIHSREDEQISFRHAERLRQALAGNPAAEFLVLDRGRHGELDPDAERRIVEFLRRSLGGAPRTRRSDGAGRPEESA
jgi:fermentation-respiration switch protein FrsA (DUF1100 family)